MPMCRITTAIKLDVTKQSEFLREVEQALAECLGKPLHYVAVAFMQAGWMRFGGGSDPSAVIEVSSIGAVNTENNSKVARQLSQLCEKFLGVPGGRVFITFTDVPAANFAHGAHTFA